MPQIRQNLESVLESAIILSWAHLLQGHKSGSGSLHLEYDFSPRGTINSLQLWLSTVRGRWLLVGGLTAETQDCIQLEGWFKSADLGSNLQFILRNQTAFLPAHNYGRAGLLQIKSPTEDEIGTAAAAMKTARSFVDSISAQPAPA
jgi:hypothetical protein